MREPHITATDGSTPWFDEDALRLAEEEFEAAQCIECAIRVYLEAVDFSKRAES